MTIDWVQAVQIGGVGFGLVFVVLLVLALVIWLNGWLLSKLGTDSDIKNEEG